jgi:2-haloacid dehalogenase
LSAFPENLAVLRALRQAGLGLAVLSNGNPQMLDIAIKSAGMNGLFDRVLSVDAVRAYKPCPAAYALGTDAFGPSARDMVFVAANGWDVTGASWFGYTTFWLNRTGAPAEELVAPPDGSGSGMADLLAFLATPAPSGRSASRARPGPGA